MSCSIRSSLESSKAEACLTLPRAFGSSGLLSSLRRRKASFTSLPWSTVAPRTPSIFWRVVSGTVTGSSARTSLRVLLSSVVSLLGSWSPPMTASSLLCQKPRLPEVSLEAIMGMQCRPRGGRRPPQHDLSPQLKETLGHRAYGYEYPVTVGPLSVDPLTARST